jgi:putative membrane protein
LTVIALAGIGIWVVLKFIIKSTKKPKNSIKILQERYAKGEISKEQFEQMKKDLL